MLIVQRKPRRDQPFDWRDHLTSDEKLELERLETQAGKTDVVRRELTDAMRRLRDRAKHRALYAKRKGKRA